VRTRLTKLEPNRPNTAPEYTGQTAIKYTSPSAKSYQAIRDISTNLESKQKYNVQGILRTKTSSNPNFSAYFDGKKTLEIFKFCKKFRKSVCERIVGRGIKCLESSFFF
jgi:hypothetical protein